MTNQQGTKVIITADAEGLPLPQCLYVGQQGTIVSMYGGWVMAAFPQGVANSGADAVQGVPFSPDELTVVGGDG